MKYNLNSRNPNSLKPKVRSNYLGIKNIAELSTRLSIRNFIGTTLLRKIS